jgi:hypothetical protein
VADRRFVIAPGGRNEPGEAWRKSANCSFIHSVRRRGLRAAGDLQSECFANYEAQIEMCNAIALPMGDARAAALCKQRAFQIYQECRGY